MSVVKFYDLQPTPSTYKLFCKKEGKVLQPPKSPPATPLPPDPIHTRRLTLPCNPLPAPPPPRPPCLVLKPCLRSSPPHHSKRAHRVRGCGIFSDRLGFSTCSPQTPKTFFLIITQVARVISSTFGAVCLSPSIAILYPPTDTHDASKVLGRSSFLRGGAKIPGSVPCFVLTCKMSIFLVSFLPLHLSILNSYSIWGLPD